MADNAPLPLATGSTRNAATDQVTYSGDVADVQLVRLVDVTGIEGSKTVTVPSFAVTGAFFQATQPVSLATNTPTLAAGTAIAGKFGIDQTTPGATNLVAVQPSTLAVSTTAAANTALTLTIPAVAGQFHYITAIEIARTATAALAGTATLVIATTNLPGSLAWSVGNAMAAGATAVDESRSFSNPLKSSVVNTATTIAMPLPGAAVLWRANVYYYTAA